MSQRRKPQTPQKSVFHEKKSYKPSYRQIFPSYQKIEARIAETYNQQYRQKLDKLNKKIKVMKNRVNYRQEHNKLIQKTLLIQKNSKQSLNELQQGGIDGKEQRNHEFYEFLQERINKDQNQYKQNLHPNYINAQSLNEFLEDQSEQSESHNKYQSYLKFKKKALFRELHQTQKHEKLTNQLRQEQKLYRNLFTKETLSQPQQKLNRKVSSQKQVPKVRSKQLQLINQNRQKLTYFYRPYLQQLKTTNIVKWRILNPTQ